MNYLSTKLQQLNEKLAKEEKFLADASGKSPVFSPTGPASYTLVKVMAETIQELVREVETLRTKVETMQER